MMKKRIFLLALVAVFAAFFTACNKNPEAETPVLEEETITSEDATTVYNLIQDTEDRVDDIIEFRGPTTDDCPVKTIVPDDDTFPRTITIDFGEVGCEGPNGRIRTGQIIVTQSAPRRAPGAVRTTTFNNFFVDGAQLSGVKTLTNEGYDQNGNVKFTRVVEDAGVLFPDGTQTSYESNHMIKQIAGGDTDIRQDDVFRITGNTNGVNRNGKAYSTAISLSDPLIKLKICRWVSSGTMLITVNNHTRELNYGHRADCDRKAKLILPNGNTRIVNIRPWWR